MRFSSSHRDQAGQPPSLDSISRDHIGALLRAAYEEVAKAPIANEHIDLLLALRHMERERQRKLGSNLSPQERDPVCWRGESDPRLAE